MTSSDRRVLAIDVGAQSGRGVVGSFDGSRLRLDQAHRFDTATVGIGERRYIGYLSLLEDARSAIAAASQQPLASVGIDVWGVDYGLIDAAGELVAQPHAYRDDWTLGAVEELEAAHPALDLYGLTGSQTLRITTLFQLWTQRRHHPWAFDAADRMLLIPDLLGFHLTGIRFNELTAAGTTQLVSARTRDWVPSLIDELGFPARLFRELTQPGTVVGPLDEAAGGRDGTVLVASPGHDTAAGVAGAVGLRPGTAFISSGSWCIVGTEVDEPIIDANSRGADLSNELGVMGDIRLLKNVIGLWLLGESRRHWHERGIELSHEEMVDAAESQEPLAHVFDPDDSTLLTPGDVPVRIARLLGLDGEPEPPIVIRAIVDSLALKFSWVLEQLETACGRKLERINLVGGGARDRALCQATADATGRVVIAGPEEATALGNVLVQLMAHGDVSSLAEGRELAARSLRKVEYEPRPGGGWDEAYAAFRGGIRARSR